jgi:dethiobiotin synthetase
MRGMDIRNFYVTGTDTGIGKSIVSAALLHALHARGLRAVGMKPVASGCERTPGMAQRRCPAAAGGQCAASRLCRRQPYALPKLPPELAAADAGVTLELAPILAAHARLAGQADAVVVEGVGGWEAPLSATLDQVDLVRALDLPVLLVVGLRLGCINHARLSARAIAADGAHLVGWVGNGIDPAMDRCDDVFALLQARLPVPCWGRLPFSASPDPQALAIHLQLGGNVRVGSGAGLPARACGRCNA